jgi:hypothetical protein
MKRKIPYLIVLAAAGAATFGVTALLMNIAERKKEAEIRYIKFEPLDESVTDPAVWGKNFPREYDGYKRTVDTERTRYGGSEAFSNRTRWRRIRKCAPSSVHNAMPSITSRATKSS